MRVVNRTQYDTKVMRLLLHEVHRRLSHHEGRLPQWDHLKVHVQYRRVRRYSGVVSGEAVLKGYWMILRLPRGGVAPSQVAWLFEHELLHSYGYKHHQYGSPKRGFDWADIQYGKTFPLKPTKAKVKVDLRAVRYERVLDAERRWRTKLKRAQTMLAKVLAKKRYYERAMAVAAKSTRVDADVEAQG